MRYVFPAVRGRMGSTEYYQASVTARDLAAVAITAGELPAWGQWTLMERFQRDLAVKRIQTEIVPYLVRTKDRFFGSLIVLVFEPDVFEFATLRDQGFEPPAAYGDIAERSGALIVSGGSLVALDGQHRLVALREVVRDTPGAADGPYRDSVASDELCVVFLKHESLEKTRRIFNKVNRHARPTGPSDNIITNEDDGYCIVARWLVEREPPLDLKEPEPPLAVYDSRGEPLVQWRSAQLQQNDTHFTTLQTIHDTVVAVLDANGLRNFDERHMVNRPTDEQLRDAYEWSATWWSTALRCIPAYSRAVRAPWMIPDWRGYREEQSLLFRPVAQVALFRAAEQLTKRGLSVDDAFTLLGKLKWQASHTQWVDTIVRSNGRMIATPTAISLTARLAAYMSAPDLFSADETNRLQVDYATERGWPGYGRVEALPKPLPASKR